jgi:hypothetical protein
MTTLYLHHTFTVKIIENICLIFLYNFLKIFFGPIDISLLLRAETLANLNVIYPVMLSDFKKTGIL